MAKKKQKSLLPKRIAGVKVPKSVRKGPLGQLLASRTGQALLAEAIMAAGAVGVAKQANDPPDEAGKHPPLIGGLVADAFRRWQSSGHDGHDDPMAGSIAYALGEAARVFVRTLNEQRADREAPQPEPHLEGDWQASDQEPRGSKKSPPTTRAAHPARPDRRPPPA
jgi:hypothetical protein